MLKCFLFSFLLSVAFSKGLEIDLSKYEKSLYSQNGEDGVIEKIIELIQPKNKFCVEFGATEGKALSNTCLLREKGWKAVLWDLGYEKPEIGLYKEFITAENINSLFEKYKIPNNFGLLSIDIDYNDFYVWKALDEKYQPDVIIIEYNATHRSNQDKVVKYDPFFCWDGTNYFGASILAMYNLGRSKGYSLVYADKKGVNLFFIRDDLLKDKDFSFKNINNVRKLYRTPRYGKGPNRGHRKDSLNRSYLSSGDLIEKDRLGVVYPESSWMPVGYQFCKTKRGSFITRINDQHVGWMLSKGKYWEESLVKECLKYIKKGSVVVDVGCNIGTFSIPCAKQAAIVYAFEPQRLIFQQCCANIVMNNINNIYSYNLALGHKGCNTQLSNVIAAVEGFSPERKLVYEPVPHYINFGGASLGTGGEKIEMRTLDSFNFSNISLIKIDVSGAESLVLYGARQTIIKNHPVIVYKKRNNKNICLDLPSEVRSFDIEKFIEDQLPGVYQKPKKITRNGYILVPIL